MKKLTQLQQGKKDELEILNAFEKLLTRHSIETYENELHQMIYHVATHPGTNLNEHSADVAKALESFFKKVREVRDNDS